MRGWLGSPTEPSRGSVYWKVSMVSELSIRMRSRPKATRSPGMSTVVAAITIVVVLVALSVGTFALLGGFSPQNPLTCEPASSPACATYEKIHDVAVLSPFKTAAAGAPVAFTASVPQGLTATSYTFQFGDGIKTTTSNSIASHSYAGPGQYLVFVQATVGGVMHDNLPNLVPLKVTQTASSGTTGSTAPITASVVSNTTTPTPGTKGVTTVLTQGQSVTVSGSYTSAPTNPAFQTRPPRITVSTGGSLTSNGNTSTSAQATALFSAPGTFELTFVGSSTNTNQSTIVYQNFTWTVFVAASGAHAGVFGSTAPQSPHPGSILAYELAPGGAASEDPAIDYETVGAEPITNVYQTLITYNGTDVGPAPTNFVPEAATCVPGSAECKALYGKTLQNGTSYTFAIEPNATFYDPANGAHWSMYPTDVVFSLARDLGFANLPFATARPGWIVAQALLGPGNESWDLIHGSYNNTPQDVFASMIINGTDCPQAALTGPNARGCVTFVANGGGHPWPDFLELIADPLGAGIVSCGWFSAKAQAAGIPYWSRGNMTGPGDQPCAPVGTKGFGTAVAQIPSNGWDQWEELGSGAFNGQYLGNVQWNMVGSGPYALTQYLVASSYSLKANPWYEQNPYCTWTGCQPKAGQYASQIQVIWETSETPGEQALRFGAADFATIPPTSVGLLLQLIQQGKVNAIQAPTLSIFFQAFNLNFNLAGAQRFSTNPITVQNDFFSYLGMREFLARAYPYNTIENTIQTRDGIQYSFNEGGAIPQFMGGYYPTNISWPTADPCTSTTDQACPAYWWAQMQSKSSSFYDQEATQCTSANPCQFPIFSATGNPQQDEINSLWISELSSLSGGAIKASPIDINFAEEVALSGTVAGQNPMPVYSLGWAPDYPDPTDYTVPMYNPNATYTAGDAVATQLEQPQFASGCPYTIHQYAQYAALAVSTGIPQACQGVAYRAMVYALGNASYTTNLTQRQGIYVLAEEIGYGLSLYLYAGQANAVPQFSSWVDINSVDTNVMATGAWWSLTGNGVQYAGST